MALLIEKTEYDLSFPDIVRYAPHMKKKLVELFSRELTGGAVDDDGLVGTEAPTAVRKLDVKDVAQDWRFMMVAEDTGQFTALAIRVSADNGEIIGSGVLVVGEFYTTRARIWRAMLLTQNYDEGVTNTAQVG